MSGKTEQEYVLGTHDAEIDRLGLQHRIWRPRVTAAWQRAGFTAGHTLLDIGCGPGYAAIDLAEIVGPSGRVVAIDRSRRFLDTLEARAAGRGLGWLETHELDLDTQPLPEVAADGAWSRWVYAFVREPEALLRRVAARIKPGGVMVAYEYVDYRAWRLSPRSEAFEAFVNEVMASWRDTGGEPDIALEMPRWLEDCGFEMLALRPLAEAARPRDLFWEWPKAFVDVGLARLVELGRVDTARAALMKQAFADAERTPGAFCITPTVLEIVARRR